MLHIATRLGASLPGNLNPNRQGWAGSHLGIHFSLGITASISSMRHLSWASHGKGYLMRFYCDKTRHFWNQYSSTKVVAEVPRISKRGSIKFIPVSFVVSCGCRQALRRALFYRAGWVIGRAFTLTGICARGESVIALGQVLSVTGGGVATRWHRCLPEWPCWTQAPQKRRRKSQ